MKRALLVGIIEDARGLHMELPQELEDQLTKLEQVVHSLTDDQFEHLTDGVVTQSPSAGNSQTSNKSSQIDPTTEVNSFYEQLRHFIQNNGYRQHEELNSILNRLAGQADAYDRDYP